MEIIIDRQSVCMGDDTISHKTKKKTSEHITFVELFKELIAKNYFPHIHGNDVVWVLRFDGKDRIAWKTKENKFYEYNKTCYSISKYRKKIPEVTFIYYSSIITWEEKHVDCLENRIVQLNWFDKLKTFFNK